MAKKVAEESQLPAEIKPASMGMVEQLPDFMRQDVGSGQDLLADFVTPPRLKMIQKATRSPLIDQFNVGDVVAMPSQVLIAEIMKNQHGKSEKTGNPFFFVPLLFYPEWVCWNPLESRGSLPAVRTRSTDIKSDVARLARNSETWFQKCPEFPDKTVRNVEHLNFIVMLEGIPEFEELPVIISFQKGEHKSGALLAGLLRMRKAPMYGQRFEARSAWRPGTGSGDWYGLDITPPTAESGKSGFVTEPNLYEAYKARNARLKELHSLGKVVADYEDEEATVSGGTAQY